MHPPAAGSRPPLPPWLGPMLVTAGLAWVAVEQWRLGARLDQLTAAQIEAGSTLEHVRGEVTRFRLEQSAGTKWPQALLEKLRTYAPMLSSARVTEPDYQSARKEMEAILVAFASLGTDAWAPIQARLAELRPDQGHDEIVQLLRAAVRVDPQAAKALLKDVLLGLQLPSPRLRWAAARELRALDLPLAQTLLRQILLTESSRGANPDRAAAGAPIPDRAAFATTGFHNFVTAYVESDDPQIDDTLLMVLGRVEHDVVTIQECVKALGQRRVARAVEPIRRLYAQPPLQQENPLFLNHCLDALVAIQGADARPFLEQQLPNATNDVVANRIKALLQRIASGEVGAAAPRTQPK